LPETVVASNPDLVVRRGALVQDRATLHGRIDSLNAQCGAVLEGSDAEASCKIKQGALQSALDSHIQQSKDFNSAAQAVIDASTNAAQPIPTLDPESARVINRINAFAIRQGWSADKLARLDKALNGLDLVDDPNPPAAQIRRAWQNIIGRGEDADLVREASQVGGLGFPGAGKQTAGMTDCTIFALANATGRPYGVVSAQATEIISQGEWHSADDRANAQAVIEKRGLNGGEVVLLAESFGQAEVVASSDFATVLRQGHPVMVNLRLGAGHEVVLTKTFQHGGETWFVVMDSGQGPVQRLFLSTQELGTMLKENGVAYRPEPGTTPNLLRPPRSP
jgi:hypothetical protein